LAVERFSHVGLCVSDLARSLRFYCEGLGFREASRLSVSGAEPDALLDIPDVKLEAVYLHRDGFVLELLHYAAPGATGDRAPRAMNALGLTHLSLRVADLDQVVTQLAAVGGRPLAATRIHNPRLGARAIFVLDPDGTRVELVESQALA
jgi:catechol 2,3-dioxygenase-like lactoylglutathione lyase family enzyme